MAEVKFNKKVVAEFSTSTQSLGWTTIYLCEDGDYINVYIEDEIFQSDELNILQEQIPKENFKDIYKEDFYLHSKIIEKDLWNMYGQELGEDEVLSFYISGYDSANQLF